MRLFDDGGLAQPAGYVLPLARSPAGSEWQSGSWFLRSERCYLIPGDSPIGYRLPLDSLPSVSPGDYPHIYAQDPHEERQPLPPRPAKDLQRLVARPWSEQQRQAWEARQTVRPQGVSGKLPP